MATLDEFSRAYFRSLIIMQDREMLKSESESRTSDYGWLRRATVNEVGRCVNRMCRAIIEGTGKADWLGRNPAMKMAAKECGIKSSPELREISRSWVMPEDAEYS